MAFPHIYAIGTHTSGGEQNYLQLASVILPLEMEQPDTRKASGEPGSLAFVFILRDGRVWRIA